MFSKQIRLFFKKPIFCFLALMALLLCLVIYFHQTAHNPSALWHIVAHRCAKNPEHKPCLAYNRQQDYALLKDIAGKAQVLLIPLQRLHGVESPALGDPQTPNYLQSAWEARNILSKITQHPISDEDVSLSINSQFARSQNQLHIHISCLKKSVAHQIHDLDPEHLPESIILKGNPYHIHLTDTLQESPFLTLNKEKHFDPDKMKKETMVVTAAPGKRFYILTSEVNFLHFNWGSGEMLQEHNCEKD
ncbi:CDP-diacylglycerol diphosphatase [Acetobacteraceae bacterium]|nr:CDP-diacylglycerol diphosphatase [Acetobacteraceae bacterium]